MAIVEAARVTIPVTTNAAQATAQLRGLNSALQNTGSRMSSFGGVAKSFLALGLAAGVARIGAAMLRTSMEMERYSAQFEVLFGNARVAQEMLVDIRRLAAQTPLETRDLVRATTMLGQYGIAGERILPTLRMLGDASMGSGENLLAMSRAFGQMSATGRLMGQDLLQMINAGFNPLQEMSRTTGRSMADLRQQMERGGITIEMVTRAFESATEEGGRFFGMNARMSRTLEGRLSTLRDAWDELALVMFKPEEMGESVRLLTIAIQGTTSATVSLDSAMKSMLRGIDSVFASIMSGGRTAFRFLSNQTMEIVGNVRTALNQIGLLRQQAVSGTYSGARDYGAALSSARAGANFGAMGAAPSGAGAPGEFLIVGQRPVAAGAAGAAGAGAGGETAAQRAIRQAKELYEKERELNALRLEEQKSFSEKSAELERQRMDAFKQSLANFEMITGAMAGVGQAYLGYRQASIDAEISKMREKGASDEEIAKKQRKLNRKLAKEQKAINLFSAIVDTAAGVTRAYVNPGGIAGFLLASLIATKGALQIAMIQKTPLPSAQFGGSFSVPPGYSADSGLLRVNSGERVDVSPVRHSEGGNESMTVKIGEQDFNGYLTKQMDRILNSGAVQIRRRGVVKVA